MKDQERYFFCHDDRTINRTVKGQRISAAVQCIVVCTPDGYLYGGHNREINVGFFESERGVTREKC